MRSRARASRKPRELLRGMKMNDGITGEEIFQDDNTTRFQRGMYMHKDNYDSWTTAQMNAALQARLRK